MPIPVLTAGPNDVEERPWIDLSPGRSEHGRRLAADIDVDNGNGGNEMLACGVIGGKRRRLTAKE